MCHFLDKFSNFPNCFSRVTPDVCKVYLFLIHFDLVIMIKQFSVYDVVISENNLSEYEMISILIVLVGLLFPLDPLIPLYCKPKDNEKKRKASTKINISKNNGKLPY